jgi:hypothetical protein
MQKVLNRFCFGCLLLFCFTEADCQITATKGSLVIVTETRQGLLIVADKRTTLTKTTYNNTPMLFSTNASKVSYGVTTKIFYVNKFNGFSITGEWITTNQTNSFHPQTVEINAISLSREYLAQNDQIMIDEELVTALGNKFITAYNQFLEKSNAASHYLTATKELPLFDFIIYGYNTSLEKYQLGLIQTSYSIEPYSVNNKYVVTAKYSCHDFENNSKSNSIGKSELIIELKMGHDSAFNTLRNDKRFKQYLINKTELYSKKQMVRFSKWLINETSKVDNTVGDTVDVAIIGKKNGFKWLEKNSPTAPKRK